jgi:outer membrane lipase/esterase
MKLPASVPHALLRTRRFAAAATAALLLAACAGGERVEPFKPTRIIAFGDEWSVIEQPDGRQYTVNGIDTTTGAITCKTQPNWVVYLAAQFRMVFPQCNPDGVADPQGILYAVAGAKVVDATAQVDAHLANGGTFGPKDLVTMFVGANDVLEQYALFSGTYDYRNPSAEAKALLDEMYLRGRAVAEKVNQIAALDGRVLVLTAPDLIRSPFGLAEEAASPGRSRLLTDLAYEFNRGLRVYLLNDGRKIGLVFADELMRVLTDPNNTGVPKSYGFTNWTSVACTVALPDCTNATLVTGAGASTWLWANDRIFTYGGHLRLGSSATARAKNNPF